MFNQWNFRAMTIMYTLVFISYTWSSFLIPTSILFLEILIYIGYTTGSIIFGYYVILWCRKRKNYSLMKSSMDTMTCDAYLFPMVLFLIGYFCNLILYGPSINKEHTKSYLITNNYTLTEILILIWIFYGRLTRFEIDQTYVSTYYLFSI